MGAPKVTSQFVTSGGSQITGVELGYAAIVGVFAKGPVSGIAMNEADFKRQFGDSPVDGFENDWWNAIEFFRNATVDGVCYGKLYVFRAFHYTDVNDPSTITAAKGYVELLDSTGGATLKIQDKYYRESPLSVAIEPGSADATSMFDIVIYEDDVFKERVSNCNMDSTSANYVIKRVGTDREWEAVDLGLGNLPVADSTAYDLTGGDLGTTGIVAADFLGTEHADGNTGMRMVESYLRTNQKPEYMMIPYFSSGNYSYTKAVAAKSLESYAYSVGIIPILGTPKGLNRTNAKKYRQGNDATYTHSPFGNAIGGTIMVWGQYTPTELLETSPDTTISMEGRKAGLLMAVLGKSWIHQAAAGEDFGKGTAIGEFERNTNDSDSELLDPIGVQVLRTDKGDVIDSHRTLSSNPEFLDEQIRRLDNYANLSINLSTERLLHQPLTVNLLRDLEASIKAFFYSIWKAYPDAFTYDDFDQNVEIDVLGQNVVGSTDWQNGKIYTFRKIAWSPAIQEIVHKYAHTVSGSEEV